MRNELALRYGYINLASVPLSSTQEHKSLVMSIQDELMRYGYVMDRDSQEAMLSLGEAELVKFHSDVCSYLRRVLGDDRNYRPIYENFPQGVLDTPLAELYFNAILHYLSGGVWSPHQELVERGVEKEITKLKTLRLAVGDDWLHEIGHELAGFPKPLDQQRAKDLTWIAKNVKAFSPPKVSVRETLVLLAMAGSNVKISSPTDVLRIAAGMSGGDISLPKVPNPNKVALKNSHMRDIRVSEVEAEREKFKFKAFSRKERKYLLGLLEGLRVLDAGDFQTNLGRWIRLAERLHPGEYARRFPRTAQVFDQLRNQKSVKVRSYAGRLSLALESSLRQGLAVLQERPGEFARRLDSLLRDAPLSDQMETVSAFSEVADRVSGKVILEMMDHFYRRRRPTSRMVMLKGSGSKGKVLEPLDPLPKAVLEEIESILVRSVRNRTARLGKIGKVYIDPKLEKMPIPYSMQSLSEGNAAMPRGTRWKIDDDVTTARGFLHWYDEHGRIDLDLSVGFLNDKFEVVDECTFYSLRTNFGAVHSGDVRHRRGNNAEYVDVPIEKAASVARYAIFVGQNYNMNSIADVPGVTFGVMERRAPDSNEIFSPNTIATSSKIACKSSSVTLAALDLHEREWILIDMERDGSRFYAEDLKANQQLRAILETTRLSVKDLLSIHANTRGGEIVDSPDKADIAFHADVIMRDYTKLTPYMQLEAIYD